jgi:hypothetical protein
LVLEQHTMTSDLVGSKWRRIGIANFPTDSRFRTMSIGETEQTVTIV